MILALLLMFVDLNMGITMNQPWWDEELQPQCSMKAVAAAPVSPKRTVRCKVPDLEEWLQDRQGNMVAWWRKPRNLPWNRETMM